MKAAVYHPFFNFADNYSLSHVVKEQLLMFTEHGHKVRFITDKAFKEPVPEGVEVVFNGDDSAFNGVTHVLTHDIVYLDAFKKHEELLRKAAKKHKRIRWLHWSHSAPQGIRKGFKPFPRSTYICMNRTDIPLMATMYNVPEALCRVVYNPRSADCFFTFHPETRRIIKDHELTNCDVLCTYPLDTGRFKEKGGLKIIKLIEALRKRKSNAKVIFVNAACDTPERRKIPQKYEEGHVLFTSTLNDEWETVAPQWLVRELMMISNVFPLLSISEGCSLTMLEAALTKQLVILNAAFPAMREFGEVDHVVYMETGSIRAKTQYGAGGEDHYYMECARHIIEELKRDKALRFNRKVLQRFNRDWIWRNQLQPLLQ